MSNKYEKLIKLYYKKKNIDAILFIIVSFALYLLSYDSLL